MIRALSVVLILAFSLAAQISFAAPACDDLLLGHQPPTTLDGFSDPMGHEEAQDYLAGGPANVISSNGEYYVHQGVAQYFFQLATQRQLIGQSDTRLAARGLLDSRGGLCGPTCGINMLNALFSYVGVSNREFISRPDFHIQRIIENTLHNFRKNARLGMWHGELRDMLSLTVQEITGNRRNFGFREINGATQNIFESNLGIHTDMMTLVSVTTGANSSHFIVILGFNNVTKRLTYADPNSPDVVYTTSYVVSTYGGRRTINMGWNGQFPGAQNGWVRSVTQIYLTPNIRNYVWREFICIPAAHAA